MEVAAADGAPPLPSPPPPPPPARPPTPSAESIDYEPPANAHFLAQQAKLARGHRSLLGYSGLTATKIAVTASAGVLIGSVAFAVEQAIERGVAARNAWLAPHLARGVAAGALSHGALALALVLATAAAVEFAAPAAAGAGVSRVLAFLNGNAVVDLFAPSSFAVRLGGACAARVSGLALGPEAPLVALGGAVASALARLERRAWLPRPGGAGRAALAFGNADHREMVAAGVAAGMAAAFGAPLGGALYALEEASGAWSRRAAWRCLLCAATAAFTMRQLAPRDAGVLSLAGYSGLAPRQWLYQVPLIAAVAAGAALLGCLLNLLRARVLRARAPRRARAARLLQAAAVAAATVAAFALVPAAAGRCLPLPREWDAAAPVRGACGEGEYSDAASLLLGGSPWAIRALLGLGSEAEPLSFACTLAAPCYFGVSALAAVCGCYLLLAALASGLTAVPGGLFMPAILTGASFGAAAGQLLAASLGAVWDVQPGVYAVVGAVAALSAVMRTGASVALTVVFVEGTGGVDLLAGITGAIIVSNIVAAWAAPEGLYERELGTDGGVHYLRHDPPHALRGRCATDLAASPARCLPPLAGVAAARAALWETTHNGFPVVAAPGGRVLGLVLRSQLEALLRARAFCDAGGQYLSPPHDAAAYEATLHAEMRDASAAAAGLGAPRAARRAGAGGAAEPLLAPPLQLEAGGAAEAEAGAFLDLAPWMDRAPISVRPETPAPRAHQLFLALSLRHLLVLDAGGAALGVITRKDLDAAAGAGWWRSAAPAPAPRRSPVAPGGASPRGWRAFAPPARALSDLIAKMSPRPGSSFASGAYFSAAASSNGDASVGGASP